MSSRMLRRVPGFCPWDANDIQQSTSMCKCALQEEKESLLLLEIQCSGPVNSNRNHHGKSQQIMTHRIYYLKHPPVGYKLSEIN